MATATRRRAISPYARRLARERGIPIEQLSGSGPAGRITAADIPDVVARPAAPATAAGSQAGLATTIALEKLRDVLDSFGRAEVPFALDDAVLRAAGCVLDDVPAANRLDGAPVAFEHELRQLVLSDIRKNSLGPTRSRRIAAIDSGLDQSRDPATLSIKLIPAAHIRPVMLPLLPGRPLRLVLLAGPTAGECLLAFDESQVDVDAAAELLSRFKAYLEEPLRLLV